jgi:hypothetical protein
MSDSVLIALIGSIPASVAAYGAILANRRAKAARDDARIIRAEVKNDHGTNLREEADHRHEENRGLLREILRRVVALESAKTDHDGRIHELEATIPPRRSPWAPKPKHLREDYPNGK